LGKFLFLAPILEEGKIIQVFTDSFLKQEHFPSMLSFKCNHVCYKGQSIYPLLALQIFSVPQVSSKFYSPQTTFQQCFVAKVRHLFTFGKQRAVYSFKEDRSEKHLKGDYRIQQLKPLHKPLLKS